MIILFDTNVILDVLLDREPFSEPACRLLSFDLPLMEGELMTQLILYTSEDGQAHVQLRADRGTVWLSQRQMAGLFDVSPDNIGLHLKNIYDDGELQREATAEESSVVQTSIQRAIESCKTSGHVVFDLFRGITEMIGSTARDEVRG